MVKDYNEYKMRCDKQSEVEVSNGRAVKATIQFFYDIGLTDQYKTADEIKDYLVTERRRPSLDQ